MKDETFYIELARLVRHASELEALGDRIRAAEIYERAEAACRAREAAERRSRRTELRLRIDDETGLEYLGDSIRFLCRAAYLRRRGAVLEAEEFRLRAEAMLEDYRRDAA